VRDPHASQTLYTERRCKQRDRTETGRVTQTAQEIETGIVAATETESSTLKRRDATRRTTCASMQRAVQGLQQGGQWSSTGPLIF
jgi:hypothetical protein